MQLTLAEQLRHGDRDSPLLALGSLRQGARDGGPISYKTRIEKVYKVSEDETIRVVVAGLAYGRSVRDLYQRPDDHDAMPREIPPRQQ